MYNENKKITKKVDNKCKKFTFICWQTFTTTAIINLQRNDKGEDINE